MFGPRGSGWQSRDCCTALHALAARCTSCVFAAHFVQSATFPCAACRWNRLTCSSTITCCAIRSRQVKIDWAANDDRDHDPVSRPGDEAPDLIDGGRWEKGYRGSVIAGTGLGHVNRPIFPVLKHAIVQGVHIVMTVQTLRGFAQMNVYDTGARPVGQRSTCPRHNVLPETASDASSVGCWVTPMSMTKSRAGCARTINHEITPRRTAQWLPGAARAACPRPKPWCWITASGSSRRRRTAGPIMRVDYPVDPVHPVSLFFLKTG